MAVDGGHGDGVAQTQVVKLIELRVGGAGGVHLVHCQNDGLFGPLQHSRHLLVGGGHTGFDVRHQDDDRGVVDGDLGLLAHEGQDLVIRIGLDAAGVHQGELPAVPVGLAVNTVPGDAGGVLHNGKTPPDDFVEQHGLAHVGAAHDGDQGLGHRGYLLLYWMRRSFRREHGVHQGEAVLVHHLDGNAQLPAQTLHGVVVQKHGLAVAHHVDGDQHPIPQVPSP